MNSTRAEILDRRKRLRAEYRKLLQSVAALLFRHDPIGMIFEGDTNTEYEPEAGTILPRLRGCHSLEDVQAVVHGEFVRWFGVDNAGPPEHYTKVASEIWNLWQNKTTLRPGSFHERAGPGQE